MKTRLSWVFEIEILVILAVMIPTSGIITANSIGSAGATKASSEPQLKATSDTAVFSLSNVISYSDSAGIYLGYEPSNQETSLPAAVDSTLTIDGSIYNQEGSQLVIGESDLARLNDSSSSNQVVSASGTVTVSPFAPGSRFQGTSYMDTYASATGVTLIPEPSLACLVMMGGLGLLALRRR